MLLTRFLQVIDILKNIKNRFKIQIYIVFYHKTLNFYKRKQKENYNYYKN